MQEPYRDILSKTVFAMLAGISLAFFFPLLYINLFKISRLLVLVQTTNLMKGETTIERYGKRSARK